MLGCVLCGHKHQHTGPPVRLHQMAQQLGAAFRIDLDGTFLDVGRVRGRCRNLDAHGVAQQALRQLLHLVRESGREQQVLALGGSSASTRCSSSAKPRSSRRSASSSTSRPAPDRRSACVPPDRAGGGVATTTSAPPRSAIICGLMETPPNTTAMRGGDGNAGARSRSTPPTWAASSRVGTSTRAWTFRWGQAGLLHPLQQWQGKGSGLAEPVCAWPSRSAPRRMGNSLGLDGRGIENPALRPQQPGTGKKDQERQKA